MIEDNIQLAVPPSRRVLSGYRRFIGKPMSPWNLRRPIILDREWLTLVHSTACPDDTGGSVILRHIRIGCGDRKRLGEIGDEFGVLLERSLSAASRATECLFSLLFCGPWASLESVF